MLHADIFPWHWIGIHVGDFPVAEVLAPVIDRSHGSQIRIKFQGVHASSMSRRFAETCSLRKIYALHGTDFDWMVKKADFPRVTVMSGPVIRMVPGIAGDVAYPDLEGELLLTERADPVRGYNPHPAWPQP